MPVMEILARADTKIHADGITERLRSISNLDYVRKSMVSAEPFLPLCAVVHATHHDLSADFAGDGIVTETKAENEAKYMKTAPAASCHFLIGRDLKLYWIVPITKQAWHAGESQKPFRNPTSIGIEIHASVWRKPKQPWQGSPLLPGQRRILIDLLSMLAWQFAWVGPQQVKRHGDVAVPPGRKFDPLCLPKVEFDKLLAEEVWWFDRPHPATQGG